MTLTLPPVQNIFLPVFVGNKVANAGKTAVQAEQDLVKLWHQFKKSPEAQTFLKIEDTTAKLERNIRSVYYYGDEAAPITDKRVQELRDRVMASQLQREEYKDDASIAVELARLYKMSESTRWHLSTKVSFFRSIIEQFYELVNVKGDGNCGLRAVIRAMDPSISSADEDSLAEKLRAKLVAELRWNQSTYMHFVDDNGKPQAEAFEDYCKEMERSGTYLGNLEMQALSRVTGRQIQILSPDRPIFNKWTKRIAPHDEQSFGARHWFGFGKPLTIYFDPSAQHYQYARPK